MTPNDYIEAEGASVELAIREALSRLGAEEADVSIEVLATPRSGLLGLGARPARVRVKRNVPESARSEVASPPPAAARQETVTFRAAAAEITITRAREEEEVPPQQQTASGRRREDFSRAQEVPAEDIVVEEPAPAARRIEEEGAEGGPARRSANLDEQSREALKLVREILDLMGEKAETAISSDAESIHVDIKGDGSGILIGRHGQTLDALEYMINRLVARRIKDAAPVTLDVASYRARRGQQLERMALAMGERAKRERKTIALEPMPPRDRRIVHLALKDDPMITTRSVGNGYMRALEIVPTEMVRESGERGERGQPRRQPREPREAPGQQGGFKHGQKRIV
jgi:spoIIIJ-associated protein